VENEKMAKGKPVGIRFDDEVRKGLEVLAEKDERSLSFLVNRACKEWLAAQSAATKKPKVLK
jgi:predicted transcriptional regulator